jgi:hypothetical protein
MSPEWMIAIDDIESAARSRKKTRLSDPLEREEWKGLDWASRLFARLLNGPRPSPARSTRPATIDWTCAHVTASRRI